MGRGIEKRIKSKSKIKIKNLICRTAMHDPSLNLALTRNLNLIFAALMRTRIKSKIKNLEVGDNYEAV